MGKYYLAVDIGASSGRHLLGSLENGKISLQEVYRFENGLVRRDGHLCWDVDRLFREILNGMKQCAEIGKIPVSVGIDTWGVDFVLLDGEDKLIGNAVGYRDARTEGVDKEVEKLISARELYERTGIQKQSFNTIYQLYALKQSHPEELERAKRFLMIPEYFHFLLSGVQKNEYTNATTTGLVHAEKKTWDTELLIRLGLPVSIFGELSQPEAVVGHLTEEIQREVGFDCEVVLPATHDTGSAVMAVPSEESEKCIYLSSGTWSLMGVERPEANCGEESRELNFTNEGGYQYRYRFLKNIMGLWMIQSARHELPQKHSFDELCAMAQECENFSSRVDVNDPSFLSPENMTEAIRTYCRRTGQAVPQTTGELFACIYHSLAGSYAATVKEIESVTGIAYPLIRIVGGGTKDDYLNRLTAEYTGKTICAGPVEATAIGNLLAQMMRDRAFSGIWEGRSAVANSFEIKTIKECLN